MKDLKFPEVSYEIREKMWNSLKVNDVLVYINYHEWNDFYDIKYFNVVKIKENGRIRLHNGKLLKYFDSNYYILDDELKNWIEKIKLEENIMFLINNINENKKDFKLNLNYNDAVKLKQILEEFTDN